MFGKLKDKLKSWTKKLSERKQEVEEISQKEKPEEIKKIPKKSELAEKIKKPELSKEIKLPTEFNVG